ncbi:hypothetical protein BH11BAC4_BH11BAC4_15660 [soil metagenome]
MVNGNLCSIQVMKVFRMKLSSADLLNFIYLAGHSLLIFVSLSNNNYPKNNEEKNCVGYRRLFGRICYIL